MKWLKFQCITCQSVKTSQYVYKIAMWIKWCTHHKQMDGHTKSDLDVSLNYTDKFWYKSIQTYV